MNTPTERTKKKYLTSSEPFYYGRRLKAEVITITPIKDNSPRTYTGKLYTHGKNLLKKNLLIHILNVMSTHLTT